MRRSAPPRTCPPHARTPARPHARTPARPHARTPARPHARTPARPHTPRYAQYVSEAAAAVAEAPPPAHPHTRTPARPHAPPRYAQYVSEAVAAVAEAPPPRAADVPAALAVCGALHASYAEFGPALGPALAKAFAARQPGGARAGCVRARARGVCVRVLGAARRGARRRGGRPAGGRLRARPRAFARPARA